MSLHDNIQFLSLRLQTNPDSFLFARLADYLLQNGTVDKAIEVCEEGLKKHPYYVTAHFVMGKCYLQKKLYDQAEKEFKRVLFFDPKFLAAHKYYAEIMQHIGWDNAVENSYRSILQIDPLDQSTREKLSALLAAKKETLQDEDTLPFPEARDEAPEELEEAPEMEAQPAQENRVAPEEATQTSEETLADEDEPNLGDQIFEAVIEEEPPSAEDEEKFSYILDDIFREESAIENGTHSYEMPGDAFSREPNRTTDSDAAAKTEAEELPEDFFTTGDRPETEEPDAGDIFAFTPEPARDRNASEPVPRQHLIPTPTPRPTPRPASTVPEMTNLRDLARDVKTNGKPSRPVPEPTAPMDDLLAPDDEFSAGENPRRKKEKIVTPTLGEIYAAQGQYAKAIGVFEILRKKEPTNPIFIEKIKYLKKKLEEASNEA